MYVELKFFPVITNCYSGFPRSSYGTTGREGRATDSDASAAGGGGGRLGSRGAPLAEPAAADQ